MKDLKDYINEAKKNKVALGHFNAPNIEIFHGIVRAAKSLNLPVIIGVSEGEEDFIGIDEIVALVQKYRENGQPVFLNADHHYSLDRVKKCIDQGFDAVIIDLVKLPIEENILITKQCVDYADEVFKKTGKRTLIEAEIGFIGTSSKILDKIPEDINENTFTTKEQAKKFVDETNVDLLAPAIGNVHGMILGGNPRLMPDRVKEISDITGVPLVLHGGSGVFNQDFTDCIKNGVSIVHINTEIRKAYHSAIVNFIKENPEEIAPYKFLKNGVIAVEQVVYERLKLFNNMN